MAKDDYPDFIESTGYGTGEGLGGWNCRHSFFPYFEGISKPAYTDKALEELEGEPITFDGKEYTQYEATQKQRAMERNMRHTQRQLIVYEDAGLKDKAIATNIRLKGQADLYTEFSNVAGIRPKFDRVRVYRKDD